MTNIKNLFQVNNGLTQTNHDKPQSWFEKHKNLFGGIEHWVENKGAPYLNSFIFKDLPETAKIFDTVSREGVHDYEKEQKAKQHIDEYLFNTIKNHSDTNFYLIFPPYSRANYAIMRRKTPQNFFLHQEMIRYVVEKTKNYKNIHIYGFEDQDFPNDIANYRDTTHYHPRFNSMFLDAIAAGTHELTPENVEDYLKRCEQKAWDYDIPALNAQVQRLLKTSAK